MRRGRRWCLACTAPGEAMPPRISRQHGTTLARSTGLYTQKFSLSPTLKQQKGIEKRDENRNGIGLKSINDENKKMSNNG